jgi:hypothetical protein
VHRLLLALATALLVVVFASPASAVDVRVRVEGMTRTIYGSAEPALRVPDGTADSPIHGGTALAALDSASRIGEFYYHLKQTGFGPYVDQIGLFLAGGSSGWAFKVNGVSPPVGANDVQLKRGDRVLWYWATFSETGGPPTLRVVRQAKGCYRALAEDDQGKTSPATGATLTVDGRRIRTKAARACIGPHRGLVRAVRTGSVRSNAVR